MKQLNQILLASVIACSTIAVTAYADDRIERQVYQDKNYQSNVQKAEALLKQKGYSNIDIEADDHRGKPALDVEAYKGNVKYDIKLSYPSLQIIKERPDHD
mgnify:CR=1 FL=1